MYSLLLMALGGLLIGGAYTFYQQKTPRWLPICFVILAAMSLVAAYLLTLKG
ncbi:MULTISPECIES: hypothetical protein [unclassified Arthrobacter]|uniref:hypothetical protein n=1 Tax=unclassified Arthrobacter TaxID=235627 RepID=UPI00159DDA90|nr:MULTISPECIES: hypothetical protein [unclassified Arthrobacter]MCQ9165683.1 hypothetical protein [Arthrobacter sp. STN4]NVM99366.1 hypothetical protein [Arthrobacter sp. SDTb3-6]